MKLFRYELFCDDESQESDVSLNVRSDGSFRTVNPLVIGDIFHVGTMDISQKSKFSHEWNGLSVSNCPDAWRRITEGFTHGDCFKISKPDMQLLDFYALTRNEKDTIETWALEQGFIQRGTLFKAITFDENDEECYSLYTNYDDALAEVDYDEEYVETFDGILPTELLENISLVKIDLLALPSIIAELYADRVLGYDGVYWDEELDVLDYSAPRGVIFNDKISSFEVENISRSQEVNSLDFKIQSAETRAISQIHGQSESTREPER